MFAINGFLINQEIVNFFHWPLGVSCLGWEIKNDMSGQPNDCVRVCNVKRRKMSPGHKFPTMDRLMVCSIK